MVSNMMMLKKLSLLQKGVHPESVCSLLRESSDLKSRINLPGAPMSPAFLYARGARQESVEGPHMWEKSNVIKNYFGVETSSGGNPRKTFSTGGISRITGPCQFYDAQKESGERGHRAPISEEVKEKFQRRPTSNRTCTSTIPQKALQILED